MNKLEILKNSLREKKCVKIIAGINNFDIERVKKVVSAAEQGGATAVDIAAEENIIYVTKEMSDLPIFVSSIEAKKLIMAAKNGADVLEIGNFDALYIQDKTMSCDEIFEIAKETKDFLNTFNREVLLSVTVPGHIEIAEQIKLAQKLEEINVDIIQTEGSSFSNACSAGAKGLLEKAQVSIANTVELTRNVEIPVMTASGITPTTANMAFAAGASAIGVGSCINKLESTLEMIAVVRSIVNSVNEFRPSKELIRV
ncbi:MAG: DUF561 domain-containing protein [Candidatus Gastranaerophilales bacterium]|nr:DUF561 domain-containing protein [Candidatus Gastranaerophilales bacterium]